MRSHEERVAAVKRRIAQEEQKKRLRRSRVITAGSAAACLALIAGISVWMPGVMEHAAADGYAGFGAAASMFAGSPAAGYLIVGLLSFLLGVCVTALCFRIRRFQREDGEKGERGDRTH